MLAERRPAEASTVTAPPPAVTAPAASPALRLGPLPLRALNHVSLCVRDVAKSAAFYQDVLGFTEVRRPSCFDFDGSWCVGKKEGGRGHSFSAAAAARRALALFSLTPPPPHSPPPNDRLFGYGLGLHLIHGEPQERPATINPRGDHLSFQVREREEAERRRKKGERMNKGRAAGRRAALFFRLPLPATPPGGRPRPRPTLHLPRQGGTDACPASWPATLGPGTPERPAEAPGTCVGGREGDGASDSAAPPSARRRSPRAPNHPLITPPSLSLSPPPSPLFLSRPSRPTTWPTSRPASPPPPSPPPGKPSRKPASSSPSSFSTTRTAT